MPKLLLMLQEVDQFDLTGVGGVRSTAGIQTSLLLQLILIGSTGQRRRRRWSFVIGHFQISPRDWSVEFRQRRLLLLMLLLLQRNLAGIMQKWGGVEMKGQRMFVISMKRTRE